MRQRQAWTRRALRQQANGAMECRGEISIAVATSALSPVTSCNSFFPPLFLPPPFFSLSLCLSCFYFFSAGQRRSSPGCVDDFQGNRLWNEEERAAAVEFICRRKKGSFELRTARFVRSILITALRPIPYAFWRGAHALSPPSNRKNARARKRARFLAPRRARGIWR